MRFFFFFLLQLRSGRYSFTHNNIVYIVNGSSVSFVNPKSNFVDRWNGMALEIFVASMVAFMCICIFIFAVFCYVSISKIC